MPKFVRYLLLAVLVVASFAPQFLVSGLLGGTNVALLPMIWILLLAFFRKANAAWQWIACLVAALAMAIPPVPNYLSYPANGSPRFRFIGWNHLLESGGLYGIAFSLAYYATLFFAASWLLRSHNTE